MGIALPLKLTLCAVSVTMVTVAGAGPSAAGVRPAEPPDHRAGADVRITPISPRPGDEVGIRVFSCKGDKGVAHSEAFTAEARLRPAEDGGLSGEARISRTIGPGAYPVDISCDGKKKAASGRVIITGVIPPHPTDHPVKPSAPVRAGGGGAAGENPAGTAGQETAGQETAGLYGPAGLAVLSGGLLAVTLLTVRRHRARRQ
ncbi:hypothetical protein PJ985_18370 [Streptomyces sp. ACA25]|uniref:hypothetical protein n=1 Tax=Streptomyces sp. ACA25 TaxID=3022596 RepID=UPI002307762A|nr:hypothetical protein [Streptomyces sp. ACA25]MDB1089528.1 hypothetical protein [Streptomyces sp. ACA25]